MPNKKKRVYRKSPNTKMVSQRYTKKMVYEMETAANILGITMTSVVAMGIEKVFEEAKKEEKKA